MEDNHLKNTFSKLKNYESEPSPRVWNHLEEKLKRDKSTRFQKTFNFSVAAALVFLFGLVFIQLFKKPSVSPTTAYEIQHHQKDSIQAKDTTSLNKQ